ncbi:DNA-binding MarR family transcriptional regulator [Pseudochelatococcus lubricantis]|uniref:DNA-binding MarR family transcriptional regulator n=1 Tax=Pseudochelatococcus lubricantis TaxID=1538102 RepID=A0ABX0V4E2_9HYPH|nr:MarR family transcriptional regulator [Pseudochelatococcus lubricantis]NIJ57951.1 DNA-binding MarR family transcriptional regulator [Pseudochelatococcus lubricantis]
MSYNPTLEDQLCFSLYATSMAINRLYKPLLDQLGITYPQYLVLNVLWEEDGRSIGAIATRLDLEPSTITPLVKRLEAAGLVTRTRRQDDERGVLVALTARGRDLRTESRCLGEALFAHAGMAAEEMIALNREVRRLHQALTGKESAL